MYSFQGKRATDIYRNQLDYLVNYGDEVSVRGRTTIELLDMVTEISSPAEMCILTPGRHWNPWLAMSEALWILAGREDVAAIKPYNSHISEYSDDGFVLYGAYGKRITSQIEALITRLQNDPSDRRAVLSIWRENDLTAKSKDPPCNNMVYFKLRDNHLHMTVINRSNDIHYGLYAVNIPTFAILQSYIAARLGVDMGHQTHLSNSFHVYTDDERAVQITDRMLKTLEHPLPYPNSNKPFYPDQIFKRYFDHNAIKNNCSKILDDVLITDTVYYPPFLKFANEFLRQYRERIWRPNEIPFSDYFSDWVIAGELFLEAIGRK